MWQADAASDWAVRLVTGGRAMMMWQYDVADVGESELTRVMFWLVFKVPRGPVKGCHVAPYYWFIGLLKFWYGPGVEPATSGGQRTNKVGLATWASVVLVIQSAYIVFNFLKVQTEGKRVGA
jgi:hypothetical protein